MMRAIITNLPIKTGRDLDTWVTLIREQAMGVGGMTKHREISEWLKCEHGLGHNTAYILAAEALKPADYTPPTTEEIIAAQYAGAKASLRPIFERVLAYVQTLGSGIRIEPRQTYVAFARKSQFALIQPSTKTRVDLGWFCPMSPPPNGSPPRPTSAAAASTAGSRSPRPPMWTPRWKAGCARRISNAADAGKANSPPLSILGQRWGGARKSSLCWFRLLNLRRAVRRRQRLATLIQPRHQRLKRGQRVGQRVDIRHMDDWRLDRLQNALRRLRRLAERLLQVTRHPLESTPTEVAHDRRR